MTGTPVRVLVLHTHPIQYLAPLYRAYAERSEIQLVVAYCDGADAPRFDRDFAGATDWRIDLLDGYESRSLHRLPWPRYANPSVIGLIWSWQPDVVVAYGYNYPTSVLSLITTKLMRKRWAFVSDNFTIESQRGRRWAGKQLFLKALGRLSDGVLAQSVRARTFYEQYFKSVFLVPHAIDQRLFQPGIGRRTATVPKRTVFLFAGKLIARKRVGDLIRAAADVPGAEVWIAGSGPDEAMLVALATELGAPVTFLGFQNQHQLAQLYQAADALVLPSSIETYGLVVSEAAGCGCVPIVSDSCGVVGSLVIHDETGLVFETGNVEALAHGMRVITDTAIRARLVRNLTALNREWSPETNCDAFVGACLALARERFS